MIKPASIRKIIENKKKYLKIKEIKTARMSILGQGENNLNYLITINNKKFILRISIRKDFEKNMKREFNSLKILPPGYGPTPLHFDKTNKIIPHHFEILTFIEGKLIKKWSNTHIKLHAKKLANLHKTKYPFWGTIYKKNKVFDIYKFLIKEIKGYKSDSPELFSNPEIQIITKKIKEYTKSKNHLFTSLKKFSLIHGDPSITNIIFKEKNVRYCDWEWLSFRDNAADVSLLFDPDYPLSPWKIKLTKKRLDHYLNTYISTLNDKKDKTIKERVFVWNMVFKYTDLLFFQWKLKNYKKQKNYLPKKLYAKHKINTLNSLKKRLNIK